MTQQFEPAATVEQNCQDEVALRDIANKLFVESASLGDVVANRIVAAVSTEPELRELVRACCVSNTTNVLDFMRRAVALDHAAPSREVLDLIRALVRLELSIDSLIHIYGLSFPAFSDYWINGVEQSSLSDRARVRVIRLGINRANQWLNRISDFVFDEYWAESSRVSQERSKARADIITQILNAGDVDITKASMRIGYQLNGQHMALVLHRPASILFGVDSLDDIAHKLCQHWGFDAVLAEAVDARNAWCWFKSSSQPFVRPKQHNQPVIAAFGRPAPGLAGFRRSHWEALEAMRVAMHGGCKPGSSVHFQDVELAALCSGGGERKQLFVESILGKLAGDSSATATLRETLAAYYDCNCNSRAAAAMLGIHHNTVRYRVEKAEQLLDKTGERDRLKRELALTLFKTGKRLANDWDA